MFGRRAMAIAASQRMRISTHHVGDGMRNEEDEGGFMNIMGYEGSRYDGQHPHMPLILEKCPFVIGWLRGVIIQVRLRLNINAVPQ